MLRTSIWPRILLLVLLCWGTGARAAEALALLTIVEGEVTLLRDGSKFSAMEGIKLAAGDIIETSPQTRLARVEFADGVIADLGPGTKALLSPRLAGGARRKPTRIYVLQGWLKLTSPGAAAANAPVTLTPALQISETAGQLVVSTLSNSSLVFSEAGTTALQYRNAKPPAGAFQLKSGEFFSQAGNDKPEVKPRPTAAFIQTVPRTFLDPLPSRAGQFKARDIAPRKLGDMDYADAAAWLDAEPMLRSFFVTQWRALARRADFRKGLADNMRAHPEWDRTVFPEKYLPKPPATVARPEAAGAKPYR